MPAPRLTVPRRPAADRRSVPSGGNVNQPSTIRGDRPRPPRPVAGPGAVDDVLSLPERDGGLVEADVGGEDALTPAHGGQRAQLPLPGGGEEPELALGAGHHLGGELVGRVQQPDVGAGDRGPVVPPRALDHRLGGQVDAGEAAALLGGAAHAQAPFSIGTPTREPYSVEEPS